MLRVSMIATSLLVAGCYPDRLERVEAVVDSAGRLHMLVHRVTAEDHGGSHGPIEYAFADETDEGWRSGRLDHRAPRVWDSTEPGYRLHAAPADRLFAVLDVDAGVEILVRDPGEAWESVGVIGEPVGGPAGASWIGSDGQLWILSGESLMEWTAEGLVDTRPTGESCSPETLFRECHFDPTGDARGQAAIYDAAGGAGALLLRELTCDDLECAWVPIADDGLGEPGGLNNGWTDRMFLHTSAGTPTVIHRLGLQVRVGAGGASQRIGGAIFRFGAAPRPSGGVVVVTSAYYSDALELHLVPEDLSVPARRIALPTIELQGSTRLSIQVTRDEHAHLVLSTGATSLVHLDVDLESSAVSRTGFDL